MIWEIHGRFSLCHPRLLHLLFLCTSPGCLGEGTVSLWRLYPGQSNSHQAHKAQRSGSIIQSLEIYINTFQNIETNKLKRSAEAHLVFVLLHFY